MNNYSEVLRTSSQQSQQQPSSQQTFGEPSTATQNVREQVQFKLANGLGNISEAASTTGIPEQAAHEIVSRAYRGW